MGTPARAWHNSQSFLTVQILGMGSVLITLYSTGLFFVFFTMLPRKSRRSRQYYKNYFLRVGFFDRVAFVRSFSVRTLSISVLQDLNTTLWRRLRLSQYA